jgi:thiol-disulfide isomerase/thioredoxin
MSFNFKFPVAYLELTDFDPASGMLVGEEFDKKYTLVMIQANYCGACTVSKPEFQKLADQKNLPFILATVQLDGEKESERQVASILDKIYPNLSGIPSYILFGNNKKIKYTGTSRTAEDLYKFVKKNIQ